MSMSLCLCHAIASSIENVRITFAANFARARHQSTCAPVEFESARKAASRRAPKIGAAMAFANSRHYVAPAAKAASDQASDWAAKRRAAIEKAEYIKAERKRLAALQVGSRTVLRTRQRGILAAGFTSVPWWPSNSGMRQALP